MELFGGKVCVNLVHVYLAWATPSPMHDECSALWALLSEAKIIGLSVRSYSVVLRRTRPQSAPKVVWHFP